MSDPNTPIPYPYLRRTALEEHGHSRQLVLMLHGAWGLPDLMLLVKDAITWILPDADLLAPHYLSGFTARCPAERLIRDLFALIDHTLAERKAEGIAYEEVLLVGYSLGSCLCLRVALDWGDRTPPITRLVSLAGTNFGWSLWPTPPQMMPILRILTQSLYHLLSALGVAVTVRTLQHSRRFAKNLRTAWQQRWNDPSQTATLPWIIHINGAQDEFVGPWMFEDFKAHSRGRFWEVPHTQHLTLIQMDDSPLGRERQLALKIALTGDLEHETYEPDPDLVSGGTHPG